ncbi:hypothetical protein N7463_008766 [Penicillium fimorum]|uniref:Uncharacterized protein n=1 Tax=Penicillium fimorum TaxID=1882269 RepID=A0A9X0C435_9EURO|nr:hypothetical protein N7463_008766 [Penicillium fimorum]
MLPGNKETSPPGNKEHTPQSTPKVSQPSSSSHPIKRWLKNVSHPVDGRPINRVLPKVDNIEYHINFSESSESGSPPAWLNETWDNDHKIRRFLCEDEVPHHQLNHIPCYEPNTIINSHPFHSPTTLVLSRPAVVASTIDHFKEPVSSSALYTVPDTISQFTEQGQMATSAQKRAFLADDTEPRHPDKRVKFEPEDCVTYGEQPEETDFSEDEDWDSDPPTSPEYKIYSASDDSDSSSSLCVQRVKRASLGPSAKNGRQSMSEPSDLDYESEEEYFVPRGEREDILKNRLTREMAKRLLDAVELPQGHDLSPDEQRTAHQLLTRGCMPTIHRHWEKDFSTLPESLFFSGVDDKTKLNEFNFVLGNDKCSEFYAIRAFQELLKICGNVRDYCNILDISPEIYIKKSMEKYLRWALSDAGVRVKPDTAPVHIIYCKRDDEISKEAFDKVATALKKLSDTWQSQLAAPHNGEKSWPALIGLVLCGPVLSAISLDTNPHPQTLTHGLKFLGHFDLADFDNDVWNTLAVAILVMHIERTVAKLAKVYGDKFVALTFDDLAIDSLDPDR